MLSLSFERRADPAREKRWLALRKGETAAFAGGDAQFKSRGAGHEGIREHKSAGKMRTTSEADFHLPSERLLWLDGYGGKPAPRPMIRRRERRPN